MWIYKSLRRIRLTRALRRLGERAHAQRVTLEASLYGGAAFTLVYGSRASTKDVSAVVRPEGIARRLATQVANELGLPEDEFGPGLRIAVPTASTKSLGRVHRPWWTAGF